MDMQPTYFLFSGKLFHSFAAEDAPDTIREPGHHQAHPHHEDPSPDGPASEDVGDNDDDYDDDADDDLDADDDEMVQSERAPSSGGAPSSGRIPPMIPNYPTPDANPIDPRVFLTTTTAKTSSEEEH